MNCVGNGRSDSSWTILCRRFSIPAVLLTACALGPSPARAASAAAPAQCAPGPGFTNCLLFGYTGGDQRLVVPAGVTSLSVQLWGAGGGGSSGEAGGAGGFTAGTVAVSGGELVTVTVGAGGTIDGTPGYGGGGAGGPAGPGVTGGSGGGMSALWAGAFGSTPLLVAGGGGGAGGGAGDAADTSENRVAIASGNGAAGAGGGIDGGSAGRPGSGQGGTQVAGGAAGAVMTADAREPACVSGPAAGMRFQGGNGGAATGSAAIGSAATGSAATGSAGNGSAGNGSAATGSAGNGSAATGSAGNGSAAIGSAATGSAGNGSAAAEPAGAGAGAGAGGGGGGGGYYGGGGGTCQAAGGSGPGGGGGGSGFVGGPGVTGVTQAPAAETPAAEPPVAGAQSQTQQPDAVAQPRTSVVRPGAAGPRSRRGAASGGLAGNGAGGNGEVVIEWTQHVSLSVWQSVAPSPFVPGRPVTYTLALRNDGASSAAGVRITERLPAGLREATWTCQAFRPGSRCRLPSGSGRIRTRADIAAGGEIVYTITGITAADAPDLSAVATVRPPRRSVDRGCAPACRATATAPARPRYALEVVRALRPGPLVPGAQVVYALTVRNGGPSDVFGARVVSPVPSQLRSVTWRCRATAAPSKCLRRSGAGIIETRADIAAGGSVTYTVTGTVPLGPARSPARAGTRPGAAAGRPAAGPACTAGCSPQAAAQPASAASVPGDDYLLDLAAGLWTLLIGAMVLLIRGTRRKAAARRRNEIARTRDAYGARIV
jgi:uncharacterized repeat protein (TIGR01451 family)